MASEKEAWMCTSPNIVFVKRHVYLFVAGILLAILGFHVIPNEITNYQNVERKIEIPDSTVESITEKADKTSDKTENKRVPTYYGKRLFDEWNFNIAQNYDDSDLIEWSEPIEYLHSRNRYNQGEMGEEYRPTEDELPLINDSLHKHNFNLYASDRISLHRSLPDFRYSECHNLIYPTKLPSVSVILAFHNESWSLLLRTIWSILNRSPRELIKEIILVDDVSTYENLQRPLDDYIDIMPATIKLIRNEKREGAIRTRLIGAKHATGSVLIFLDAHSECAQGWLPPLLARIVSDRSIVAVPQIDWIYSRHMGYLDLQDSWAFMGLRWDLMFAWIQIPEREKIRRNNERIAPVRLPTHVGCAFAIDRDFFFEIGGFDEGMDIWGGENKELAFRVWQCGGSLELIPCSHVGHLYRVSTYSFDGDKNSIISRNDVRVAEVWMDEMKPLFYAHSGSKKYSSGDVTDRINIRNRLQCKSFRWFLENVYPESSMLQYILFGEIRSVGVNRCLDIPSSNTGLNIPLKDCHNMGRNQFFVLTENKQIRTIEDHICVGVSEDNTIITMACSPDNKLLLWNYDAQNQWIIHLNSMLCMEANEEHSRVQLNKCERTNVDTIWTIKSDYKLEVEDI